MYKPRTRPISVCLEISIRAAKLKGYYRLSAFVFDPVETFLASSLITMQTMDVVSHTVCAHIGDLKNSWDAADGVPPPLGLGAWLPPRIKLLSHMHYLTKFRRSRSKHTGVCMEIRE